MGKKFILACGHFRILLNKFPNLISLVQDSTTENLVDHLNMDDEVHTNNHGDENEVHEAFDIIGSF